jgi:hypothetical protein
MEATTKVKLKSLEPYRHLFPKATTNDDTIKKGASVSDTVNFIPKVVEKAAWQVEGFVDQELSGLSTYEACEKLWNWVKYHIRYQKDERGLEQVRSPRRLVHDGYGDCDCFTTFISTCLQVLGVPVILRITKYKENYFQHIYPVVPVGEGKIIMDCVVDRFNYEEPYSEKKDYDMDLQYLDGIDDDAPVKGVDAQDLFGWGIGDLGKLFRNKQQGGPHTPARKPLIQLSKKPVAAPGQPARRPLLKKPLLKPAAKEKLKKVGQKTLKVVNKVNKVNPATMLLRAGILASMKLNLMNVAEKLKWAYLSKEEAGNRGMDVSKYDKLKAVLTKSEQIFFAAGGKPENLKKAILTGKGNKNKDVVAGIDGLGEYTPLPEMLGAIYQDEFVNGMEGFDGLGEIGELGEPATTTAAITAASGAIASLAVLLKSIGVLFPGKKKEKKKDKKNAEPAPSETGEESATQEPESEETPAEESAETAEESESNLPVPTEESAESPTEENENMDEEGTNGKPVKRTANLPAPASTGIKLFWEKNKAWIRPVGIGAVVVGACVAGYRMLKKDAPSQRSPSSYTPTLNGVRRRKNGKRKRSRTKSGVKHMVKARIALM